jgi:hypothetical protein
MLFIVAKNEKLMRRQRRKAGREDDGKDKNKVSDFGAL